MRGYVLFSVHRRPSDQCSLPSFQMIFCLFLVSFCLWYQTCCFCSILLYVYMWRVRFIVYKCAREWLSVLVPPSIHFLDPRQSPRMKLHFIVLNDRFLVTLGFLAFICWFFLRCFFNRFWLMKSKKRAYVCAMKLRYNYLVNLLL